MTLFCLFSIFDSLFLDYFLIFSIIFLFQICIVRNGGTKVVHWAIHEGLGLSIKKFDVLTWRRSVLFWKVMVLRSQTLGD